jgi:hypothetical protein
VGRRDGPGALPRGGKAWGECGANVAVGRHSMAGSSPATVLTAGARTGGAQSALKQGRAGADRWAPATVPGGDGLNTFQVQMNSNYFKTVQSFTDPKMAFPSTKN